MRSQNSIPRLRYTCSSNERAVWEVMLERYSGLWQKLEKPDDRWSG
jgi:hypothetical protein